MIRRPPRSTRTATLFPYTTLFRSTGSSGVGVGVLKPLLTVGSFDPIGDCAMVSGSGKVARLARSEEHTSELQSLMRISYAVFCLKKKKHQRSTNKLYAIHEQMTLW